MATNRSINSNLNSTSDRIVAFFKDKSSAYKAMTDLKEAGFTSDEIGLAVADDSYSDQTNSARANAETRFEGQPTQRTSENSEHDRSFWQSVKDFFTGEDNASDDDYSDFRSSASGLGWNDDRANYYHQGIRSGGALVTVTGSRSSEARSILERDGGDLRESGFDTSSFSSTSVRDINGRNTSDIRDQNVERSGLDEDRRIQLRGEMLRAQKERVQRGEVRLRKDVVTENKTIEVPVTREELVIERTATPSGTRATGDIGSGSEEIRVPLSEERVRLEKQQVVNEEVRVGKRQVQRTEHVSGQERHEELRVDKEGDVEADTDVNTGRKKRNPAA